MGPLYCSIFQVVIEIFKDCKYILLRGMRQVFWGVNNTPQGKEWERDKEIGTSTEVYGYRGGQCWKVFYIMIRWVKGEG